MQAKCAASLYVTLFMYIYVNFFAMTFDLNDIPSKSNI